MFKSGALRFVVSAFLIILIPSISISATPPDKAKIMERTAKLQIPFIENKGQVKDTSVKFYANTFAGNVYVTDKGEIVYGMMRENLVGAKNPSIKGNEKAVTNVNYFVGDKKDWKSGIPTWQSVSLGEVYDGIELNLKAYSKNVEKLFIVNECGSVEDIKVSLEGADNLEVNYAGELEVETLLGTVKFTKPVAYQEINGKRVNVKCEFVIASEQSDRGNLSNYGFRVASYNRNYPLVIDPLLASTFIGNLGDEWIKAIAIDASRNIYITGKTEFCNYPTTPGAYDTTCNYGPDIFVSKLDNNLSTLLSSTFIGGIMQDVARAIAIDPYGNVIISGITSSYDYPKTSGAYDTSYNGSNDGFVSKFNSSLTLLMASTFIGGINDDGVFAEVLDSSGNIIINGYTNSNNYPTTLDSYDTSYNGNTDSFITKLDKDLSSLLSSTFVGGTDEEYSYSVDIDSSGNIYIGGLTSSLDFPTTIGSYDTSYNGGYYDAFVAKFNKSLTSLLFSTLIGGSEHDSIDSIDAGYEGFLFASGSTRSADFPTTPLAYNTSFNNSISIYDKSDAFILKLDNTLSALLASTFFGGSNEDFGQKISVDINGNVFLSGLTYSSDLPIASNVFDTSYNGDGDVFISKFDNNLSSLLASTFLGGCSSDYNGTILLDSSGDIFVAGVTQSFDFPITPGAYDTSFSSWFNSTDIFISKFDNNLSGNAPTAITLSSFAAEQKDKKVIIKWQTATEIDNLGFNIYRSESENGQYIKINKKLIHAKGSSTKGASYKFKDRNVITGKTYWYKLEDVDSDNTKTMNGPKSVAVNFRKKK
ncbi:MAG: SBBP repeat-containing protein [Candidatus Schekmanbacteria bacterium]|nr:SBBP repeat-containing protein [Candidatus Schekmanbacteria bacterium]